MKFSFTPALYAFGFVIIVVREVLNKVQKIVDTRWRWMYIQRIHCGPFVRPPGLTGGFFMSDPMPER